MLDSNEREQLEHIWRQPLDGHANGIPNIRYFHKLSTNLPPIPLHIFHRSVCFCRPSSCRQWKQRNLMLLSVTFRVDSAQCQRLNLKLQFCWSCCLTLTSQKECPSPRHQNPIRCAWLTVTRNWNNKRVKKRNCSSKIKCLACSFAKWKYL